MSRLQSSDGAPFEPVQAAAGQLQETEPLQQVETEYLVMHAVRHQAFFREAQRMMQLQYFDELAEPHLRILWGVIGDLYEQFDTLSYEMVANETVVALNAVAEHAVLPEDRDTLLNPESGVIYYAFYKLETSPAEAAQDSAYARRILRRFLHERSVVRPLREMSMRATLHPDAYPVGLPDFLDGLQNHRRLVNSMDVEPVTVLAPTIGERITPSSVFVETGMSFFDGPLEGMRVGDCNGILGVTGGGKTTLGCHAIVSIAETG